MANIYNPSAPNGWLVDSKTKKFVKVSASEFKKAKDAATKKTSSKPKVQTSSGNNFKKNKAEIKDFLVVEGKLLGFANSKAANDYIVEIRKTGNPAIASVGGSVADVEKTYGQMQDLTAWKAPKKESDGFTSSDPEIKKRIAEMQKQVIAKSSLAGTAKTNLGSTAEEQDFLDKISAQVKGDLAILTNPVGLSDAEILEKILTPIEDAERAQFLSQAKSESDPFYTQKFTRAREDFERSLKFETEEREAQLAQEALDKQIALEQSAASAAKSGLATSGIRQKAEKRIEQRAQSAAQSSKRRFNFQAGSSIGEALALQQQISGGSTPSLSGRPDVFAVQPTAAEVKAGIQDIVPQAGFDPVTPRIATGEELGNIGDVQTFAAEQELPAPELSFADKVRRTVETAKKEGREEKFSDTSSQSFDNQLLIQRGLLYKELFGDSLTPEELRFLSPAQQAAVREGKKDALQAELGGVNSILAGREDRRKEDEDRLEKEQARSDAQAETTFNVFSKIGFDKMSDEDRILLEGQIGLPPGTLSSFAETQKGGEFTFDVKSTERGGFIQFKKDKDGQVVDQTVLRGSSPLKGPNSLTSDTKAEKFFTNSELLDAYDNYKRRNPEAISFTNFVNQNIDFVQPYAGVLELTTEEIVTEHTPDIAFGVSSDTSVDEIKKGIDNAVTTQGYTFEQKQKLYDVAAEELKKKKNESEGIHFGEYIGDDDSIKELLNQK